MCVCCVVLTDVADAGAGVAEDHHGGAVVVVHEGPEVGAGAGHGPLRHDVLPGVGVALHNTPLIFCTTKDVQATYIDKNSVDIICAVVALE